MSDRARGIGLSGRIAPLLTLSLVALGLAIPGQVTAQRFPGFGGVELRGALYGPEDAKIGAGLTGEADLGWWGFPYLRLVAALYQFSADVKQDPFLGGGRYSAIGTRFGGRLTSPLLGPVRAHFVGSLTLTNVDAEVEDRERDDKLQGLHAGAELGLGFSYALDPDDRFSAVLEARRTASSGIGRFGVEAGIRYTWRGRDAYLNDPAPVPAPAGPVISTAQQEQDSIRAALERERAEREAREAEARARADIEAVQRAAEEARRAVEEERRRQEALDLQRQADADARFRARQEAAEAERRLYESLLGLERSLSTITSVRGTERGVTIVLGEGTFGSGQSSLSTTARNDVRRLATFLAQLEDRRIAVEGHTDSSGSASSNQRLSEQRAEAVRAALIDGGVDAGIITAAGYGSSRPVANNSTAAGRAQNRRVEIIILGMRAPER